MPERKRGWNCTGKQNLSWDLLRLKKVFLPFLETSIGWLLRWAVLVLKARGRRTALAELPVQKNTEPVFITKFQKSSVKVTGAEGWMPVVVNDISHSDYFWGQSTRPSVVEVFSLAKFCIILTLAPTYPLWSWFCSAKNLNTAPCYSWSRDFSSFRSPSKTGDVTRKNCCQQQGSKCSWWRQVAGSEDLLSYEWMSSSAVRWPQLPCSQEEQRVFLDQQILRLFRAGELSLLAHLCSCKRLSSVYHRCFPCVGFCFFVEFGNLQ